jgi:hypothetical protein
LRLGDIDLEGKSFEDQNFQLLVALGKAFLRFGEIESERC